MPTPTAGPAPTASDSAIGADGPGTAGGLAGTLGGSGFGAVRG